MFGAWEHRWIADDGLIVLRTVRNLLAGNGPVFNMGERVEANTSTAWTYLVFALAWLTGLRLEYLVLGLALALSAAGLLFAMAGSRRFWGSGSGLLLPAGALVYIATDPARDFATSGLENSLSLFWLGLLWFSLMWLAERWARGEPPRTALGAVALFAGLAPLVRPELALVGGAVLLLMVLAPVGWPNRFLITAAAGALPVGYQIFRMGYYGALVPTPAIAKDASGSKWSQGWHYLLDFVGPYWLWLPVLLVAALLAAVLAGRRGGEGRQAAPAHWATRKSVLASVLSGFGVIEALYWVHEGGDFMHGRVLLAPLFCALLPIMVIPVRFPWSARSPALSGARVRSASPAHVAPFRLGSHPRGVPREVLVQIIPALLWAGIAGWALFAALGAHRGDPTAVNEYGIVDERRFYSANTGHAHPILAEDYLDYPRMHGLVEAVRDNPTGGVLFPGWDADWVLDPLPDPPLRGQPYRTTVYFLNLGMSSMNLPLNVRVLDQMGLAYPLASHTERIPNGRLGHDKLLFGDWVIADAGGADDHPYLPAQFDSIWVRQAREALTCPETVELLDSYRAPLTWERFKQNLKHSLKLTGYRIDRVPKYELQRCGLPPVQ
ncbi:hypothetical protein [Segniliparus rugosus]